MKAELIDYMGDDLRVANAARVSFDKESDWEHEKEWDPSHTFYMEYSGNFLSHADQKLISYLAKHDHWTPFSHVMITMRETVPIFVARQRFKHVVGFTYDDDDSIGFTYNEISRRYVDSEPEFYIPTTWRKAAENKKQGSGEDHEDQGYLKACIEQHHDSCLQYYQALIANEVAPEQARMVLPQSMFTSYYVTGSLAAWARAYKLRSDNHAQHEIQELAGQWNEIISGLPELKYSWTALTNKEEQ